MRRILTALGLLCALPHAAAAQRTGHIELVPPPTHERWFVTIDANLTPVQAGRFSNAFATPNPFLPSANDVVAADYTPRGAFGMDVGFGGMVTSRVGIGATRSRITYDDVRLQTRTVRPRLLRRGTLIYQDGIFTSFDETSSHRKQMAYHVEVSAVPLRARGTIVRAFAGPSYVQIAQTMARRITHATAFVAEENPVGGRGWGYHAGLDLSAYIPTRSKASGLGVGMAARYARATVASINGLDPAEGAQDYENGAWHITMGMRVRF